jgi:selenocysteine lyase/cysteine desulfurase
MMKEENREMQHMIYLNTAAAGLLSPASVSATTEFQQATLANPGNAFMQWLREGLPVLRDKVARLLKARPSQIAFGPNFSYSLLPVIQSIQPFLKKVLLYKDDYPSLNMPFELGGFEVHYTESPDGFSIPLSQIREIIEREKIELIAISHVQFLTGFTFDLNELGSFCREKGIVLVVDATQSMGATDIHFDSLPVDVLISSSYKWLNGGYGSAVLCIKEEFIQRFPPRFAGFGSLNHTPDGWDYQPSVTSYEPGHLNILGLLQLEQAVDQRMLDGIPAVEQHNRRLLEKLTEGLSGTPFNIRGGNRVKDRVSILCFEADEAVADYLSHRGFILTWRKGLIRVSPHFYNTGEEIDALVKALKEYK